MYKLRVLIGSLLSISFFSLPATTLADEKSPRKEVVVNLKEQKLSAYENGKEKFHFSCVTGTADHPTVPGTFKIFRKLKEYRSKKYQADMPYSMFFSNDGKAIHAGLCCVDMESFVKSVAGDFADWIGSHGCVRLSKDDARTLFDWADNGTPVRIVDK